MVAASAVFAVSLVLGAHVMGWAPVVLLTALMAVLGACFGVAWNSEPEAMRRMACGTAGWAAFGIVVLLALPPTLGAAGLLTPVVVALTSPGAVVLVRRELRRRGGRRRSDVDLISDRELARRWEVTAQMLADPRRTTAERVAIVEDRGRLLDELERRDRYGFEMWLTREGWLAPLESTEG
jgi:hypothetical protein